MLSIEIYCRPLKKLYETTEAIIVEIDDTWSLDLLDLGCFCSGNNRQSTRNFSTSEWTIPLKKGMHKFSQTLLKLSF